MQDQRIPTQIVACSACDYRLWLTLSDLVRALPTCPVCSEDMELVGAPPVEQREPSPCFKCRSCRRVVMASADPAAYRNTCDRCSRRQRATRVREHERAIGRILAAGLRRDAPMPECSRAAIERHRDAIAELVGA